MDYFPIKIIGEGAYSRVWLCMKNDNQIVAVKTFKMKTYHIFREMDILNRIDHPNIIKPLEYNTKRMVMPAGMSNIRESFKLMQYVHENLLIKYFKGMLGALEFLYRHGVIVGDIKPDNFLIMDDGEIKLIDFSLVEYKLGKRGLYSAWYRPPEALSITGCNFKSDMWALGCTMYEIMTGFPLFPCSSEHDLRLKHRQFTKIKRVHGRYMGDPDMKEKLYDLIELMIKRSPFVRISPADALKFMGWDTIEGNYDEPIKTVSANPIREDAVRFICEKSEIYSSRTDVLIFAVQLFDRLTTERIGDMEFAMLCLSFADFVINGNKDFDLSIFEYSTDKKIKYRIPQLFDWMINSITPALFYPNKELKRLRLLRFKELCEELIDC